ncbi:pleckstrin homology domain-containing family B member 1-like [Babylonia areolata]|uniref:pleckstrin homology domain-containing family B member 1-like n=1 Tax=Babylonia areolata TaxID=304850 RepID=UPI003FD25CE4
MSSELEAQIEACLRAGWIYHLKTTFRKVWQKKWMTIKADGTMVIAKSQKSEGRKTQNYDLKKDCMFIRVGGQCQHLLPPANVDSGNLMELLMTGDRRLAFCGLTPVESELWYNCIEAARSETSLPKHRAAQILEKEKEEEQKKEHEGSSWCCMCSRKSQTTSSVKALEPSPEQ